MNQRGTLYDEPDLNCPELDQYYAQPGQPRLRCAIDRESPSQGSGSLPSALVGQGIDLSAYNTTENEAGLRRPSQCARHPAMERLWLLVRDRSRTIADARSSRRYSKRDDRLSRAAGYRQPSVDVEQRSEGITAVFDDCRRSRRVRANIPISLRRFTNSSSAWRRTPSFVSRSAAGRARGESRVGRRRARQHGSWRNRPKRRICRAALIELAHGDPRMFLEARAAGAEVPAVPEQALGYDAEFRLSRVGAVRIAAGVLRAGKHEFPNLPDSVLINAPQLPFEHELCQAWNVPMGPASQRVRVRSDYPNLGRVGRDRREDRRAVGAIRREHAAELDLRAHQASGTG